MAVEENPKSLVDAGDLINNANPSSKDAEKETEEGEIAGNADDSSKNKAIPHQPHHLEHSWTFWFDNPSAKSRQATWGSSMRSIYTFSTIEGFWR